MENFKLESSARDLIFQFKFLLYRLMLAPIIPADFKDGHPFLPGLEMYRAIEYAISNKSKIEYLGSTFNPSTTRALKLETDLNAFGLLKRAIFDLSKVTYWR
jgi:hypothetical protein